jgi:membrane associated rhomboid family serine protease
MIPIRDDNPTAHPSLVVYAVIALNAAAWIFVQGMGTYPRLVESVFEFGVIPGELLGLVPAGTRVPVGPGMEYVFEAAPNYLSVFTHMFMHGGWLHIIGNMWFLYVFGDNIEDALGSLRFLLFYLICGLSALVVQVVMSPGSTVPMVGASGAISGIMGAYIVLFPRAPVHMLVFLGFFITRIVVPAFFMLGYWFLLQLLGGVFAMGGAGGGVAFWAHVGGFVAGMILVIPFCDRDRAAACRQRRGVLNGVVRRVR